MTANKEQIKGIIDSFNLPDFGKATIREIVGIGKKIEAETGMRMARMEMGVPGVPASEIGVNAEIEALKRGVASVYPTLEGEKELKEESSRFIKAFIGVDVAPECCVPAVGSMNGVFAAFTPISEAGTPGTPISIRATFMPVSASIFLPIPTISLIVALLKSGRLKLSMIPFITSLFAVIILRIFYFGAQR